MREFAFRPGTRTVTKERAGAVAWATNRRGRHTWKGPRVTEDIRLYLERHGYNPQLDRYNWVRKTLATIVDNDLGYWKLEEQGKNTVVVEFGFHDDVNLNGQGLPVRASREEHPGRPGIQGGPVVTAEVHPYDTQTQRVHEDFPPDRPVVQSTGIMPPLPGAPVPAPYRLDELVQLLTDWSHQAPEDYAKWVEAAIESLGGVVR